MPGQVKATFLEASKFKTWPEEELTFIMRTIGHKNNDNITRAQLSQAIESSLFERFRHFGS